MEFILLPLLLLAGLLTTLGDDDDGSGPNEDSDNDTLAGSGTDRIFGGEGDDDLTLTEGAAGLGGVGDDTISAGDEALGYGLEGNDNLTGSDNATIKGGEGDDWLTASDEALAEGGAGNDHLMAEDDALANGGVGDDTLTASAEARAYGGDGNDHLYGSDLAQIFGGAGRDWLVLDGHTVGDGGAGDDFLEVAGPSTVTGGAGNELFVAVTDRGDVNETPDLTITDFDASDDELAVLLHKDDTSDLTMTIARPDGENATVIEITGDADELIARITLQGVTEFDPASLRFFDGGIFDDVPFTGTIVQPEPDLTGTGTETVHGGAGNDAITLSDSAVGYGEAGDDTLAASDTASANGGDGADSLFLSDEAQGDGGAGDDRLFIDVQRADEIGPGILHGTPSQLTGGAGSDAFVMTGFPLAVNNGSSEDATFEYAGPVVIHDFDPAADSLGVVLGAADLNDVTMEVSYSASTNATTVVLSQGRNIDGDFTSRAIARVELRGVTAFDPADLRLYSDTDLTPLDLQLQGSAGDDVLESFGHPSGGSYMQGGDGNDTLHMQNGTVTGGNGDDVISGRDTLFGGSGDDLLTVEYDLVSAINHSTFHHSGQADGGDGNDTIHAFSQVGVDDQLITTGTLSLDGGAGDDFIMASDLYRIDAGSGDDTVSIMGDAASGSEAAVLGNGDDVLAADTRGEYGVRASAADFDPAHDRLAVIAAQGPSAPVVTFTWDAVRGGTVVSEEDVFEFFLAGVNHETTPITLSYYTDPAALNADQPYFSA